MKKLLHVLVLSCAVLGALTAADRRGVVPEDYYAFKSVSDTRLSPDGRLVAYVVTSVDAGQNRRYSAVWLAPADGSPGPRQLTTGPSSHMPRWSPDGRTLAFLSARSGKPQVYVLPMSGGEARGITDLEGGVESFHWSPEGERLVCATKAGPEV